MTYDDWKARNEEEEQAAAMDHGKNCGCPDCGPEDPGEFMAQMDYGQPGDGYDGSGEGE